MAEPPSSRTLGKPNFPAHSNSSQKDSATSSMHREQPSLELSHFSEEQKHQRGVPSKSKTREGSIDHASPKTFSRPETAKNTNLASPISTKSLRYLSKPTSPSTHFTPHH